MVYNSRECFNSWYNGIRNNNRYIAAEGHITSSAIRINNCIQTISFNDDILLQECYHAEQDAEWRYGEPFITEDIRIKYSLLDINNNSVISGYIRKGDTVDVSQYPTAISIILELFHYSHYRFRPKGWNPADGSSIVGTYHRIVNGIIIEYTYDSWLFEDRPICEDIIMPIPQFHSILKQAWYMADEPTHDMLPEIPLLSKPKPAELVALESEEYRKFLIDYEPQFYLEIP